jgi:hypothetical protein
MLVLNKNVHGRSFANFRRIVVQSLHKMNSGLFAIMGDYGHDFFHWRHFSESLVA